MIAYPARPATVSSRAPAVVSDPFARPTSPADRSSVSTEPTPSPGPTEAVPPGSRTTPGPAGNAGPLGHAREAGVVAEFDRLVGWFAGLPAAAGDGERVDRIAGLERLRGAVAAAQARETVAFASCQVAA